MNIHFSGRERPINHDVPKLTEGNLLFLGGLMGLSPSFRTGNSGQSLAEAARVLNTPEASIPEQPGAISSES